MVNHHFVKAKTGILQGRVLVPILFNLYDSDVFTDIRETIVISFTGNPAVIAPDKIWT